MKELVRKFAERVVSEADPEKDRHTGLVVFGTLDVALGIFCFSLAMLLLIIVSSSGLHGMKPIHYAMTMGLLFFLAGWFIVMGLGSMKGRRWARAQLLIGAWVSVFFGTLGLALFLHILPELYNMVADFGLLAPSAAMVVLYIAVAIILILQVAFPLQVIAFYSRASVRFTCERLNPDPSWTDRCPLPLLAMGFICLLGCLSIVTAATTNYTVFLYGRIVSGSSGFGIVALLSAACGYVGWGAFTCKMHAWWGAYVLVLVTSSSMMLTFSGMDLESLYAVMGYSAEQVAEIRKIYPFTPASLTFASCIWGIMACVYLLWVRDCFRGETVVVEVKSYEQRKTEEEATKPEEHPRARMRLD